MTLQRTYEEAVHRMGEILYNHYTNGGSIHKGIEGVQIVSFIYDVPVEQVREDAWTAYESLWPDDEEPASY